MCAHSPTEHGWAIAMPGDLPSAPESAVGGVLRPKAPASRATSRARRRAESWGPLRECGLYSRLQYAHQRCPGFVTRPAPETRFGSSLTASRSGPRPSLRGNATAQHWRATLLRPPSVPRDASRSRPGRPPRSLRGDGLSRSAGKPPGRRTSSDERRSTLLRQPVQVARFAL